MTLWQLDMMMKVLTFAAIVETIRGYGPYIKRGDDAGLTPPSFDEMVRAYFHQATAVVIVILMYVTAFLPVKK